MCVSAPIYGLSDIRLPIFQACKTCDTFGSTNCSTEGEDGPGVADADFVVYVAARDFRCEGVLAFAGPCFEDKSTDRYYLSRSACVYPSRPHYAACMHALTV